jgi:hypothetical protein
MNWLATSGPLLQPLISTLLDSFLPNLAYVRPCWYKPERRYVLSSDHFKIKDSLSAVFSIVITRTFRRWWSMVHPSVIRSTRQSESSCMASLRVPADQQSQLLSYNDESKSEVKQSQMHYACLHVHKQINCSTNVHALWVQKLRPKKLLASSQYFEMDSFLCNPSCWLAG